MTTCPQSQRAGLCGKNGYGRLKRGEPSPDRARVEWDSDRYGFSLERLDIDENFRPEMGFIDRAQPGWKGMQQTSAEVAYKPTPGDPVGAADGVLGQPGPH